jgi:hypothetical protein
VTPANKGMWVYDGAQWIAASAASTAILTVFKYTATAAQTTFTGADDNSLTLTYTAGSAIITVNGAVMEVGTDVTATTGTSIVLAQAALAGDEVNIYAFATFNIANTYTQAQTDATFLPKVNPSYTGTLTGGTGVIAIGTNQIYKDASGLVGLGTASPTQLLSVYSAGAANALISAGNGTTGVNGTWFGVDSTGNGLVNVRGAYPLIFSTTALERMRITSGGDVGINTSTPSTFITGLAGSANGLAIAGASIPCLSLTDTTDSANYRSWIYQQDTSMGVWNGANGIIQFGTVGTERCRIDASGSLLVGVTTAQSGLASDPVGFTFYGNGSGAQGASVFVRNSAGSVMIVNNKTASSGLLLFYNGGNSVGSITSNGTITIYNTTSDYRLKNVIGSVTNSGQRLDALKPIEYDFKTGGRTSGFLAHQFAEVYPNSVSGEKDAVDKDGQPVYQGMQASSSEVMADLIAEIQSLRKRVAQLEGTI